MNPVTTIIVLITIILLVVALTTGKKEKDECTSKGGVYSVKIRMCFKPDVVISIDK